jgi:hypothetical protein
MGHPCAEKFTFIPFSRNFNVAAERTIRIGILATYRTQVSNVSEMRVISAISLHCDFQNSTIVVSNRWAMLGLCLKIFNKRSRYAAGPSDRAV